MSKKNPIVGTYKGVTVRKCNPIVLKLGEAVFKSLIDEVERTGLSIPKILAYSSRPCDRCKDVMVVAYNKDGNEQKIKRGILSKHIPQNNGINIIQTANAKSAKVSSTDQEQSG